MHYYRGYTIDAVLDEPARRFYLFLDHALKISAEIQYNKLTSSLFPYLKKEDREMILRQWKSLAGSADDSNVDTHTITRDRTRLRALLNQNNGKRN